MHTICNPPLWHPCESRTDFGFIEKASSTWNISFISTAIMQQHLSLYECHSKCLSSFNYKSSNVLNHINFSINLIKMDNPITMLLYTLATLNSVPEWAMDIYYIFMINVDIKVLNVW